MDTKVLQHVNSDNLISLILIFSRDVPNLALFAVSFHFSGALKYILLTNLGFYDS